MIQYDCVTKENDCKEKREKTMRKHYLDNIRWFVIILVILNHTVSTFSSCKAMMSYNADGIAALDAIGYFIYPWFMPCLFLIAGMSAKYALEKRTEKEFLKERRNKLLLPFLTYWVILGSITAEFSFRINHSYETFKKLPDFVVRLIWLVNGIGPAWFLLQLFLISLVFLLVLKLDKNKKLLKLGEKCNVLILLLFYVPLLLAAQVLYVAYTYRNCFYLLLFLLGYFVFSHEKIQEMLKKYALVFLAAALIVGALQTYFCWGEAYQLVVNRPLVVLYTWLMILAVLGCFHRFFSGSGKISSYLSKNSFGIYLFHYLPLTVTAYYVTTGLDLPVILNYILTFVASFGGALVLTEIVKRIPILNTLFGLSCKRG